MFCGKCKTEKPTEDFTKINISKDGTRGLCKECKRGRDRNYVEKSVERLKEFDLIPDMLNREKARIGVLNLHKFTDRQKTQNIPSVNLMNIGLKAILKELNENYEYCDAKQINDYEIILISLTSVMDIENLIYTFEKYAPTDIKAKIIVGGFGVCNIKLITKYIDVACFGRGEGQINDIIANKKFDNVWRKSDDQNFENKYSIRQAQYLVNGELGIGCRYKCKFCHYTHVRLPIEKNTLYNPGKNISSLETDWNAIEINGAGRYTSAWDGWSEFSRRNVCKPVTNESIAKKLIDIGNANINGGITLKVFQIVGYPWETPESIINDIKEVKRMLQTLDSQIKNNLVLSFLNSPFGPEPLTPMQYEPANIYVSWPNVINFHQLFEGMNIKAHIAPCTSGAFTLLKRVYIHRAEQNDLELFKRIVFSKKLNRLSDEDKVCWLQAHKIIDDKMFGKIESASFDYLIPPVG